MTTAEDVIVVEPLFDPTAPPDRRLPPREWARRNLWSTPFNALLTVVFGAVLAYVAYRLLRFVFVTADWEVVRQNLRLFMVGQFPEDELWRPWTAAYILAGALGLTSGVATAQITGAPTAPLRTRIALGLRRFWPLVVFGIAILTLIDTMVPGLLLIGLAATVVASRAAGKRVPGLARWVLLILALAFVAALIIVLNFGGVGWDDWGGLQLTLFVATAGILIASPFGLVLALARRSTLPLVRWMAVGFIELFRGVPLVALLFMGQYIILFTFPTSVTPPGFLVRAVIVIALFEAAYIAEIVRGGLQSVSQGQVEAAHALGMGPVSTMRKVVLPQALRAVIPAIVGQFISLFKDTSLLAIVGFLEVLQVARSVPNQDEFAGRGLSSITLAFAGFIYWVGAYTLSRESRRLERRLGVGTR
jgi:general L-amino acid transport system permease protein